MQIHELASLSTALASGTFFAVDNGSVTRKLDFGNLVTGIAGNGAVTRMLTLDVDDWSDIKTKMESISTSSAASFYCSSTVAALLTGDAVSSTLKGTIYRISAGTYDIMAMVGTGGSNAQFITWRLTNVTTSGATINNVSKYLSVNSNGAADARTAIGSLYAKYYTTPSNVTSFAFDVPNSARSLIIIGDGAISYNAIFFVIAGSNGVVNVADVFPGSFTYDKSEANKVTFTRASAGTSSIVVISLKNAENSIPTLVTSTT